jgi:hypothetical protein
MEDGRMETKETGGKVDKGGKVDSAQKTRGKIRGPNIFTFHLSLFSLLTFHLSPFLTSSPSPLSYIPSLSPESGLR